MLVDAMSGGSVSREWVEVGSGIGGASYDAKVELKSKVYHIAAGKVYFFANSMFDLTDSVIVCDAGAGLKLTNCRVTGDAKSGIIVRKDGKCQFVGNYMHDINIDIYPPMNPTDHYIDGNVFSECAFVYELYGTNNQIK